VERTVHKQRRRKPVFVTRKRRTHWGRVAWFLVVSLVLHTGVYLALDQWPQSPAPEPPPEPLRVEMIDLKKLESPALAKPVSAKPGIKRPSPKPRRTQVAAQKAPEPVPSAGTDKPAQTLLRSTQAQAPEPNLPPISAPAVIATQTNPENTFVKYPDGSVTLRSPSLARPIPGSVQNQRVRVSKDGRIDDGRNSKKNTKKRLAGMLPNVGARSPKGFDLGRMDWNAGRLAASCGVYGETKAGPAPAGVSIFIDSSGSMGRNFYTSPATTCAYALAKSAIQASDSTRVGVISFSDVNYVVAQTRDLGRISDGLAHSLGGKTLMPGPSVPGLVPKGGREDIVVITDTLISNHEQSLPYYKQVLARNRHNQGLLIIIGDGRWASAEVVRKFIWAGFRVSHHRKFDLNETVDRRPQPRPKRYSL
jgi:hypothetical protein